MSNRILLGLRGSTYGLWVSKPGVNVLTASDEDLLFSSSKGTRYGQLLSKGVNSYSTTAEESFTVSVTVKNNTPPFVIYYVKTSSLEVTYPTGGTGRIDVSFTFPSTNTCDVKFTKSGNIALTLAYFISTLED